MPRIYFEQLLKDLDSKNIEEISIEQIDNPKNNDELLVLRFSMDGSISKEEFIQTYNRLYKKFANQLIAVPKDYDLITMSKEELSKLKDRICEFIDFSDYDDMINHYNKASN